MNIRNKILTKEEISKMGNEKMQILLSKYPTHHRSELIEFHNLANNIDYWMSEKLSKINKVKR